MRRYTQSLEWVEEEANNQIVFGLSKQAKEQIGEIVYVQLPEVGLCFQAGEALVLLESRKAALDIYTPLCGEIIEVNEALLEDCSFINSLDDQESWIYKMRLSQPQELELLMDEEQYRQFIAKGLEPCLQEGKPVS